MNGTEFQTRSLPLAAYIEVTLNVMCSIRVDQAGKAVFVFPFS